MVMFWLYLCGQGFMIQVLTEAGVEDLVAKNEQVLLEVRKEWMNWMAMKDTKFEGIIIYSKSIRCVVEG